MDYLRFTAQLYFDLVRGWYKRQLSRRSLLLILQDLLDGRSGRQTLHPGIVVGVIAFEIDLCVPSDVGSQLVPCDEAQISICTLVSNKVFPALQNGVQNHGDSLDLGGIAVFCRLDLL